MQLYALDENNQLIFAERAIKGKDYLCLECGSLVHLRGGIHRRNHFFHLEPHRSCHLSKKGMIHLQLQWFFLSMLPQGDCQLEKSFPSINRIADVVWLSRNIIFEIQCSPITASEVLARNRHYGQMGFSVVWILHDKRFNQKWMSAAEFFLQEHTHYFSNMDLSGQGFIYDQFSVANKGRRIGHLPPIPVDVTTISLIPNIVQKTSLPYFVHRRLHHWRFYCGGDIVSMALSNLINDSYLEQIMMVEKRHQKEEEAPKRGIRAWMTRCLFWIAIKPYLLIFRLFLEKACK